MRLITLTVACCLALAGSAQAAEPSQYRVVGGAAVSIQSHPHQAALVYDASRFGGDDFDRQFCGGTLITPRIVQTAAHCLVGNDPDDGGLADPNDLDVVVGRAVLSGSAGQRLNVLDRVVHPDYDDPTLNFDAAWLVLAADAAPPAAPALLAGPDETALWAADRPAQVSGWGNTTEGGAASDALRAATVPIVSDPACDSLGGIYSNFRADTMVCAGFAAGGVDTCQGDSGGPLVVHGSVGSTTVTRLVGITSWGDGCARADAPGVYTRIAGGAYSPNTQEVVDSLERARGLADAGSVYGTGAVVAPSATQQVEWVTPGEAGATPTVIKRFKRKCGKGKRWKRGRCVRKRR